MERLHIGSALLVFSIPQALAQREWYVILENILTSLVDVMYFSNF